MSEQLGRKRKDMKIMNENCTCSTLKESQHLNLGYQYLLRKAADELPWGSALKNQILKVLEVRDEGK